MKLVKLNLLIAVGLVLLLFTPVQSQFVKTLGGNSNDYGECVIQGSDGGIIIAGNTNSYGAGGSDLLLVNYDASGNLLLTRALGGVAGEGGYSVIETQDGALMVTGYTNSFGAGSDDLFLAKLTYWGGLLWAKTLGGGSSDLGNSMIETSDGGIVITGSTNSYGAGYADLLLVKFDASGDTIWTRTLGGEYDDIGYSVTEASDGGIIVTGYTYSFGVASPHAALLLAKFDAAGNHLWTKTLGGTIGDDGYSVIEASDGGLVVTGYTASFGTGSDLLIAKFHASGDYLWTRTIEGAYLEYEREASVIEASDGGLIVAGNSSFGAGGKDLLLTKFDASGNHLWTRVLGDTLAEQAQSVTEVSGGGLVAAGYSNSFGAGGNDLFLVALNASGNTCLGEFVTPTVWNVFPPVTSPDPTITWPSPTLDPAPATLTPVSPETTTVCEGFSFIRGDVDGDCLVGWYDFAYLWCYLYNGGPAPPCMDAADVNDEGIVDLGDIIGGLIVYFRYGVPPPPPFPDPGPDPTPDDLDCDAGCISPIASELDSLIVPSEQASPGEAIAVPIIMRNCQDLLGYQIYLEFDPDILLATGVDTTSTATGEAGPDKFEFWADNAEGTVEIWCIIHCWPQEGIPPGRDTLVKVMFQVDQSASCATTPLDLKSVTGPPFTGSLLDYSDGKVYPTLVDGDVTSGPVYPEIDSIADVGNDQGKQVRVEWSASCFDDVGLDQTITQYSIWRRAESDKLDLWNTGFAEMRAVKSIDEMLSQVDLAEPGDRFLVSGVEGSSGIVWVFITTVPAMQFEEYAYDAPTECDATLEDTCWSVFFVAAHTEDPLVHYDSDPDSGFSLDNIPPLPIQDLGIDPDSWFTLEWTVPGEYVGEHPISTYDIRYNTIPVGADTQAWWDSAEACAGEGFFNLVVGEEDSFQVAEDCGCHPEVYFAVRGLDDRPNASEISNIVHFLCGDVNGDGVVDLGDVLYEISYLYRGGLAPVPIAAGDVNCDGIEDLGDLLYKISYLYKGGLPPCGS